MRKHTGSWTVGTKLYASFAAVMLLLGGILWTGLNGMEQMNRTTTEITEKWMLRSVTASQISYWMEHAFTLDMKKLIEPDPSELSELNSQSQDVFARIDEDIARYRSTLDPQADPDGLKQLESLSTEWAKYKSLYPRFMELAKDVDIGRGADRKAAEVNQLLADANLTFSDLRAVMDELLKLGIEEALNKTAEAGNVTRQAKITLYLSGSIALVISLLLAYGITRNISRPVRTVSAALKQMAGGDLSRPSMEVKNKDEIGELVTSLNGMTRHMRGLIRKIQDSSSVVASASKQMLSGSEQASHIAKVVAGTIQEVAAGSENQLRSSADTARAMEEMSQGVLRIAETSSEVAEYSTGAAKEAHAGGMAIEQTITRMSSIHEAVGKAGEQIDLLKLRSQDIVQMVGLDPRGVGANQSAGS